MNPSSLSRTLPTYLFAFYIYVKGKTDLDPGLMRPMDEHYLRHPKKSAEGGMYIDALKNRLN